MRGGKARNSELMTIEKYWRKNMKRKILSVLLTVAMTVSVLAGCGNGNAGEQTDGNTSETTGDTQNSGTDASADSAEAVELETITVWSFFNKADGKISIMKKKFVKNKLQNLMPEKEKNWESKLIIRYMEMVIPIH